MADIGLDVSRARVGLVERADVAAWLPPRRAPTPTSGGPRSCVAAGSPGMTGAAHLAARAAQRAGAGMVRVASPGVDHDPGLPTEAVGIAIPPAGWDDRRARSARSGRRARRRTRASGAARRPTPPCSQVVASAPTCRSLVDGDGLSALGDDAAERPRRTRPAPRSSRPTTASSPASPATRRATTASRRPATWPPPPARSCCSRARPRSSPTPTGGSCCRRPATPGWPPRAPATCSPASIGALLAQGVAAFEAAAAGRLAARPGGAARAAPGAGGVRRGRRPARGVGRAGRAGGRGPAWRATAPATRGRLMAARAWAEIDLAAVAPQRAHAARRRGPGPALRGGEGQRLRPRRRRRRGRAALEAGADWLARRPGRRGGRAARRRHRGADPRAVRAPARRGRRRRRHRRPPHRLHLRRASRRSPVGPRRRGAPAVPLHLKVDTGMHRVGGRPADVLALAQAHRRPGRGSSSRACAPTARSPTSPTTRSPRRRSTASTQCWPSCGPRASSPRSCTPPTRPAALVHPATRYDLVRCGIAVYGIPPAPDAGGRRSTCGRRSRCASEVSFVKRVAPRRGASPTGTATGPSATRSWPPCRSATPTACSGRCRWLGQEVLIGGERRPMVGVVTMDQLMVDCGPDADVEPGDPVVLLGAQGDERITPDEWAARLGTISLRGRVRHRRPGGAAVPVSGDRRSTCRHRRRSPTSPALRVGHWTDAAARTGCTVVAVPRGHGGVGRGAGRRSGHPRVRPARPAPHGVPHRRPGAHGRLGVRAGRRPTAWCGSARSGASASPPRRGRCRSWSRWGCSTWTVGDPRVRPGPDAGLRRLRGRDRRPRRRSGRSARAPGATVVGAGACPGGDARRAAPGGLVTRRRAGRRPGGRRRWWR